VRRLARAHFLLCHAMQAASSRYGLPLLVDMTALLLNLVFTSYFFLEKLLPSSSDLSLTTAMECVFAFMHIARIVMLVQPTSMASYEVSHH
jgi:hypothetical protein